MNQSISAQQNTTTETNDNSPQSTVIRVVSSMAPRLILEQLLADFSDKTGIKTHLTAMGGVNAAEQVKDDDSIDVAVLSKGSISALSQSEHLDSKTRDIALSEVAVAVKSGTPHPDLSDEASVKQSVLTAKSIGYSTGPSGRALADLFQQWGISEDVSNRLVCPPPGVPVGKFVATGDVELGFQQRSELIHIDGIDVLGPLPANIQIKTIFTAGVCKKTHKREAAIKLIDFLSSPQADSAKRQQGMLPV